MPLRKTPSVTMEPMRHVETISSPVLVEAVVSHAESKPLGASIKADKPMTRDDWNAKDRRISRQGLFQAALQSPAIMQYCPDIKAYLEMVRTVADEGLRYVNE